MAQFERIDKLIERLATGADQALAALNDLLVEPTRWGGAVLVGLRAALAYRNADGVLDEAAGERDEQRSEGRGAPAG